MPTDVDTPLRAILGEGAPVVFMLRLSSLQNDMLCEWFANDCSPCRFDQAGRYRRQEDRLRCLAAGWLLNHSVTAVTGTGAVEEKDVHGRPMLRNLPHVYVSLSHAGTWIVCALHGAAVGIDVETEAMVDEGMAKLFMSESELHHYRALPELEEQKRFFYSVWTMKEAYLKALGTGFARSPQRISIDIGQDTMLVEDTFVTVCGSAQTWHCYTDMLSGEDARLSLCWLSDTSNHLIIK
jgi:4'-phosphopantetheinyl transferase